MSQNPRNVRNFWVSVETDARNKPVETGPKSANGGFFLSVKIRENGQVSDKRLLVYGEVNGDKLQIVADNGNGKTVLLETVR